MTVTATIPTQHIETEAVETEAERRRKLLLEGAGGTYKVTEESSGGAHDREVGDFKAALSSQDKKDKFVDPIDGRAWASDGNTVTKTAQQLQADANRPEVKAYEATLSAAELKNYQELKNPTPDHHRWMDGKPIESVDADASGAATSLTSGFNTQSLARPDAGIPGPAPAALTAKDQVNAAIDSAKNLGVQGQILQLQSSLGIEPARPGHFDDGTKQVVGALIAQAQQSPEYKAAMAASGGKLTQEGIYGPQTELALKAMAARGEVKPEVVAAMAALHGDGHLRYSDSKPSDQTVSATVTAPSTPNLETHAPVVASLIPMPGASPVVPTPGAATATGPKEPVTLQTLQQDRMALAASLNPQQRAIFDGIQRDAAQAVRTGDIAGMLARDIHSYMDLAKSMSPEQAALNKQFASDTVAFAGQQRGLSQWTAQPGGRLQYDPGSSRTGVPTTGEKLSQGSVLSTAYNDVQRTQILTGARVPDPTAAPSLPAPFQQSTPAVAATR